MKPNSEIERLLAMLEDGRDSYEKLAVAASQSEAEYRVAHAKALLRSEGTSEGKRAAEATVACERLLFDRKLAEALRDAHRERLSSIRCALEALRTLSANERSIVG